MSGRATDADLPKAKIVILDGRNQGEELRVRFNPSEYSIEKGMSYPWVSKPRSGAMGGSRQKNHTIKVGDRGEHE